MKPSTKLHRTASITGAVLVLLALAAFAMPAQAAYVAGKTATAARAAVLHVCERFCGCHHHHHCHEWCDGYRHFHCPGHE